MRSASRVARVVTFGASGSTALCCAGPSLSYSSARPNALWPSSWIATGTQSSFMLNQPTLSLEPPPDAKTLSTSTSGATWTPASVGSATIAALTLSVFPAMARGMNVFAAVASRARQNSASNGVANGEGASSAGICPRAFGTRHAQRVASVILAMETVDGTNSAETVRRLAKRWNGGVMRKARSNLRTSAKKTFCRAARNPSDSTTMLSARVLLARPCAGEMTCSVAMAVRSS